jgi:hypothetical protein
METSLSSRSQSVIAVPSVRGILAISRKFSA